MIRTLSLLLLILSLVIPSNSHAQVSSVQGTVSDGSTLTIVGSGFRTGDNTPLVWDNFQSGTAGSPLKSSPQIGSWTPDSRPVPVYSTTQSHSGSQSCYAAFDANNQWSNFLVNLPLADRFYQSFWYRWSTAGSNGQLKLMQVHGNSGQGDFAPGVMTGSSTTGWWFTYITTESGANDINTRVNYPFFPGPGTWHHFEMILQKSSGGNTPDGRVIIWIDNKEVYRKTNAVTREQSTSNWQEISFFHGVTNMGTNTDIFLDDAYLNDSWARVIIGDSPTYANITHSETQVVTQWSDTSIKVTLNKGSFSSFTNTYLYVIDQDGNVNSGGFPLSQTSAAPKPPANLKAQ